jgi:hypothetical protein
MSVSRSWTLINDEDNEISDSDRAYLDGLMEEWSQISTEIEYEGFQRQADYEDGNEPYFETDEEYEEYKSSQRTRSQRRQVKLDIIENMLAAHGARVMRPYEHWNEDERYMEYAERDRDDY